MKKLVSILASLAGCSATQVDIPRDQDAPEDLDLALEAWAESAPDSYRYTMVYRDGVRCGAFEYKILVRNGRTKSSESRRIPGSCYGAVANGHQENAKPHLAAGATIANLLTYIVQIDCPVSVTYSREVYCPRDGKFFEARYHPRMGFPISFRYTYGELLDEQLGHVFEDRSSKLDYEYRLTEFQIVE